MDVLACVKRVPDTGAKITLTDDQQDIDTSNLGFTMSPHEECAIEETIQLTEDNGGTATVLTLGSEAADEQLRTGLAMGADEAVHLRTDGEEWTPRATAGAIADAIRQRSDGDVGFDVLLFGNESADMANYQVGVRVAEELNLPCVAGIKSLDVEDGTAVARREVPGGEEIYEVDLPAVITVKEGINEPRYASMRGKMQARRQEVDEFTPEHEEGSGGLEKVRLEAPETDDSRAEILGESTEAIPAVIELLEDDLEVL